MQVPLEISFHHIEKPEWADNMIRERADRLEQFFNRITSVRVHVEPPAHARRTGGVYGVHVEMGVPGKKLVVSQDPHRAHERFQDPDLATAIRVAFDAAEKQLRSYKAQLNGDTKAHDSENQLRGQVSQLYPKDDHGFLLTAEGAQLYFHRNALQNANFDDLRIGAFVYYIQTTGDIGPMASKVRLTQQS